ANAGGIDQNVRLALVDERRIDGVARGAGLIVDEHTLGAHHGVDERRLADVGPADDRDGHGTLAAGGDGRRRCAITQRLEHGGDAAAMVGRAAERLAKTEAVEIDHGRFLGGVVDLVGNEHHRLVGFAQQACDLLIERGRAGARVHEEGDQIGVLDRGQHLATHALDERLRGPGIEPAGVDDGRLPALEVNLAVQTIARHARYVAHEGLPATDEPIEQRRFADVRSADDGDYGAEHTADRSALGSGATTRTGTPTAAARSLGVMSSRNTPSRSRNATAGTTIASPSSGSVARWRAMSCPVSNPVTETLPPKKWFGTAATRAVAPGMAATRRSRRGA